MTAPNQPAATSPAGSIYDLGYRHYEGVRHGRLYAMWSLYVESLRGVWGFGRPTTAKAAPFIILGIYSLLAIVQLAFSSVFAQAMARGDTVELLTYANYFATLPQWADYKSPSIRSHARGGAGFAEVVGKLV